MIKAISFSSPAFIITTSVIPPGENVITQTKTTAYIPVLGSFQFGGTVEDVKSKYEYERKRQ